MLASVAFTAATARAQEPTPRASNVLPSRRGSQRFRRQAPAPTPPSVAVIREIPATVRPSENPLAAPATALRRAGDDLVIGLADGGIALWDERGRKGLV